jgi:hypothetical protein
MNQDTKRYLEIRNRKMWKQLFTEGLDTYTNEVVKETVLNAQNHQSVESTAEIFSTWICHTMERLDALVQDSETRRKIMLCCSSRMPIAHLQLLQEVYEQSGDLDSLIEFMNHDLSRYYPKYSENIVRDGNRIYITKGSPDSFGFDAGENQVEKPPRSCHCSHIRPAIRSQKPLSSSFCLCGTGWYKHLWEELLKHPVQVEVLETISNGANRCRFVIHLLEKPSQRRCGSVYTLLLRSDDPKGRVETIH